MVTRRIVLVLCCSFLGYVTGEDQTPVTGKCKKGFHQCGDQSCIPNAWRCDKQNDCEDKSDELSCRGRTCLSNEFPCADGWCVPERWVCDQEDDCGDGSDENNCPLKTCSPDLEFTCRISNTTSTICINSSKICDGTRDCPDGSDEKNCSKNALVGCASSRFFCPNGLACIELSRVCDGNNDCTDGGDERPELCTAGVCGPQQFRCKDKGCIGNSLRCNELVDCPDGSDEEDCHINNEDSPGACSPICRNEGGTSRCDCEDRRLTAPVDRKRNNVSLILTNRLEVLKISLDHQERKVMVREATFASGLDFIYRTGVIFWSDIGTNQIYKTTIKDRNTPTEVISENIEFPYGLAVDWIYNHVYWTERGANNPSVGVATLDGSIVKTLILEGMDKPSAIVVDPLEGWLFWSDLGKVPKIEKAGLDGSHRQIIVSSDITWPGGLTLDLVQKRLYWADAMLNAISSCEYDGSGRRVIVHDTEAVGKPYSIGLFEDYLYWTNMNKPTIYRANKLNGSDVTTFDLLKNRLFLQARPALQVYHPSRQPEGVNHCGPENGHCSHLCLPAPQVDQHSPKTTCACPDGLFLMSGGLACDDSLIYATCH